MGDGGQFDEDFLSSARQPRLRRIKIAAIAKQSVGIAKNTGIASIYPQGERPGPDSVSAPTACARKKRPSRPATTTISTLPSLRDAVRFALQAKTYPPATIVTNAMRSANPCVSVKVKPPCVKPHFNSQLSDSRKHSTVLCLRSAHRASEKKSTSPVTSFARWDLEAVTS